MGIARSTVPQVENYLQWTFATFENNADTEDEKSMFAQPPNKTPL